MGPGGLDIWDPPKMIPGLLLTGTPFESKPPGPKAPTNHCTPVNEHSDGKSTICSCINFLLGKVDFHCHVSLPEGS